MLKSIKIPEEAYKDAKKLSKRLEETKSIEGLYRIKLSTAVSYAIKRALENIENRRRFLSAAGGWSDVDADKLIKDIYENRKIGVKKSISFD